MSMRFYSKNSSNGFETGYIDIPDNKPSTRDIANGIRQYKHDEEMRNYIANGGQLSVTYSYFSYLLHITIAVLIGGFIWNVIGHAVIGVLIGIIAFVILTIRCIDKNNSHVLSAYKNSIIKRLVIYTIITAGIAIFVVLIKNRVI